MRNQTIHNCFAVTLRHVWHTLMNSCACVAGVHNEGAGREIQAAGSPRGSHAEGVEVSPTTEGGTPRCEMKCLERNHSSALLQNEF